jgi:hypothetical protein
VKKWPMEKSIVRENRRERHFQRANQDSTIDKAFLDFGILSLIAPIEKARIEEKELFQD